jgi:hypothetical protein
VKGEVGFVICTLSRQVICNGRVWDSGGDNPCIKKIIGRANLIGCVSWCKRCLHFNRWTFRAKCVVRCQRTSAQAPLLQTLLSLPCLLWWWVSNHIVHQAVLPLNCTRGHANICVQDNTMLNLLESVESIGSCQRYSTPGSARTSGSTVVMANQNGPDSATIILMTRCMGVAKRCCNSLQPFSSVFKQRASQVAVHLWL